jgi:hypothetical protein
MLKRNFDKIKTKNLRLPSEYDRKGNQKIIALSNDGVDLDMCKINTYRTISNLDKIKDYRLYFDRFCEDLNITENRVRWDLLVGKKKCDNFDKILLKDLRFSIDKVTTYHTEILPRRSILYQNLTQIKDSKGLDLEVPVYSHAGVTGRTTIKKGFNFLTSKKDFRKSCKSKTDGNILVSIDFKACEPNLFLRSIGREVSNPDIYEYLSSELDLDVKDRSTLKRGILSVLYGASDSTSSRILGSNKKTLDKIKDFFKIEEIEAELKEEFSKSDTIYNLYGRPIHSDKSILNKWIQSSAVDFCSLAFLNFVEEFNLDVCYLVHDDMVVDVDQEMYEKIKDVKELYEPISKLTLPVEVTKLSA